MATPIGDARHPVVVELFQSQGCSSCPPANDRVIAVASDPNILVLTYEVTYWDKLGWTDTFGNPAFTNRQYDYATALKRKGVYTPQVIVNGRVHGVGSRKGELEELMEQGDRGLTGPEITVTDTQAYISTVTSVAGSENEGGELLLVRYNPRIVHVAIKRGENAGRNLPHANIVCEIVALGKWNGQPATVKLPKPMRSGLKTAVLLHAARGGPILAAGHN
eukprot:TRINITY_DN23166_c0_g1_i1.p1 TRINITY_DN23166_c0_g1~~TRINITY_DN23166_c0_g1_i1.p1  ORF type:complete len:220 (+),score=12.66 TRINITY_DN23166_c0_g1_i1:381-1040(+)